MRVPFSLHDVSNLCSSRVGPMMSLLTTSIPQRLPRSNGLAIIRQSAPILSIGKGTCIPSWRLVPRAAPVFLLVVTSCLSLFAPNAGKDNERARNPRPSWEDEEEEASLSSRGSDRDERREGERLLLSSLAYFMKGISVSQVGARDGGARPQKRPKRYLVKRPKRNKSNG